MSRVLVVNSGSSSLKYQLIELEGERMLASGLLERIGEARSSVRHTVDGQEYDSEVPVRDHTAGFDVMLTGFASYGPSLDDAPTVIGHRVVHGGTQFLGPTVITGAVKRDIEALSALAPLHNPSNLAGIIAAEVTFPGIPQVAVFDTAFHQTLAPVAYTYAIDAQLALTHRIRRYGFHGISHKFVAEAAASFLDRPLHELRLIVLHIGNGASACAVSGGRSVETSMGMTPLEGLIMGTRGGDIDPGALIQLQHAAGLDADSLDHLLNHGSGLLGLSGYSDIRDVERSAADGDEASALAVDVYQHRIRHYVGAYLAQLGGADAIVFTAGVGENNATMRAGSLVGMEALGVRLDTGRNRSASRKTRFISSDDSKIAVLVVPTNEELEIARQSFAEVTKNGVGGCGYPV